MSAKIISLKGIRLITHIGRKPLFYWGLRLLSWSITATLQAV